MLFFSSEEDFKKDLDHTIEWNEERIGSIKKWIGTQKEWLTRTSDAAAVKSLRDSIKKSADTIEAHRGFIARARQRYARRYGRAELTVIRGGLCLKEATPDHHPEA